MTDVRGARILRLINDPAVGGDLLLVGMAMAAKYDFGLDYQDGLGGLARLLWPESVQPAWQIRGVLRRDIRTYKPPETGGRVCTAPMVKRAGECGKSASSWGYLTDWATGEMYPAGGCSRHRSWFMSRSRANWGARPEVPPLPCANHGGALRPHFPRIDWVAFWRRLNPRWVLHPERVEWPKPDLSLVLGDGRVGGGPASSLSLVPMGGA